MTPTETRIGFAAFCVLTAGAVVNIVGFQNVGRGSMIETSAISGGSSSASSRNAELEPGAARNPSPSSASPKISVSAASADTAVNRAEVIRGIQRELNTRGYGTSQPDGVVGLMTRAAIMAYEYDYGLPLTAEPTQDLLSRIVLGTAGPAAHLKSQPQVKTGEAESVVRSVKQYLSGLGYAPGKIDGHLSEDLIRATRDFELDQKMPETGRISGQLVTRLMRLQGQGQVATPVAQTPTKPVAQR